MTIVWHSLQQRRNLVSPFTPTSKDQSRAGGSFPGQHPRKGRAMSFRTMI